MKKKWEKATVPQSITLLEGDAINIGQTLAIQIFVVNRYYFLPRSLDEENVE